MASSLDRSAREAQMKKKEASEERKKEHEAKKDRQTKVRERRQKRNDYRKNSAAHFESRSVLKTLAYSAGILLTAFVVFEVLLLVWKSIYYPGSTEYTNDDMYWHFLNIADTCIGFLVGILAMDILNYVNQNQRNKREEERAIIRHNRIIQPCIEMYLARKNCLVTPNGEDVKHFQVKSDATIRDLKDMYDVSGISSDAGRSKVESFQYFLKKLNNAFLNMAEDINFDYNPELCDAVMKFLNDTVYGQAAVDAVVSFGKEGNRTQKMNIIRKIKESPDDIDMGSVEGELNAVVIFMRMIHSQEEALDAYMKVIEEIDYETKTHKRVH